MTSFARSAFVIAILFSAFYSALSAPPPYPGQWKVLEDYTDEFDGAFNTSKWQNKSPSGWQGRLPGWFAPYNVQVHNGSLQLFARHENITDPNLKKMGYANFTTSFVASQRPVRYGYFEIRARVGSSKVSSSFWFYNSNTTAHHWTEIDVFEMTGEHASQQLSTQDAMHTHVFMLPKENTSFLPDLCDCSLPHETALYQLQDAPSCSQANYTHRSTPYSQDFHVFGLLWTPEKLEYTVDGLMQWSLPNACMHQPLFLTFDRETMPDWFGLPSPVNLPDQPLTVEYVRAWTQDDWS